MQKVRERRSERKVARDAKKEKEIESDTLMREINLRLLQSDNGYYINPIVKVMKVTIVVGKESKMKKKKSRARRGSKNCRI